jgi:hypothetical protein
VRRRRRRWPALAGLVVVAGLAAAGVVWVGDDDDGSSGRTATATTTAAVERRDLVRTDSFDGELGYGEPRALPAARRGVVTSVPEAGSVIEAGGVLFAVNTDPTVLLTGELPAWRALDGDTSDGRDVRQLNQALMSLGYGAALTVDETFSAATADAVMAWETDLGRPDPDGSVELGDVVFQPGPLRVASVDTYLGSSVQAGMPILTYTATTKLVTVPLAADDTNSLAVGDEVTIELPDGSTTTGTVERVSANATTDPGRPDAGPTVPVTITLADPAAADAFDTATVTVDVTRERRDGVLAVPVTALLALTEGGYAVQISDASAASGYRLVAVEPGLFADGWVEVSGRDLTEGTEVVVPG